MKIAIVYRHTSDGYTGAVRDMGGPVVNGGAKHVLGFVKLGIDVLICETPMLNDLDLADSPVPMILVDPFDGSQLRDRYLYQWPSVKAVLKRSCLTPPERNNEWGNRYHVKMMEEVGVRCNHPLEARHKETPLQLTADELAKVYPLVSFANNPSLKGAAEYNLDFSLERRQSTHFAGTTAYSGSTVQTHRLAAYAAAKASPHPRIAYRSRALGIRQYRDSMKDARTVLSPWGWGETAYRDFEAMFTGAVLVKPPMRHVATWPDNLFVPDETFIECGMMFEDAVEIVERVGRDWPKYRTMRETARERGLHARDRHAVRKRLEQIIAEVL